MLKKLLLAIILAASFSAYSQFPNAIATAQLPPIEGMILDVIDYNNDGWEDVVYQNSLTGNLRIYRNLNGVFSDVTGYLGLPTNLGGHADGSEAVFSFDYNNDGFQDLLIARSGLAGYFRMFKNRCGTSFIEVSGQVNLPSNPKIVPQYLTNDPLIQVSDVDRNGYLDILFLASNLSSSDVMILSNNAGTFATPSPLINSSGVSPVLNFAMIDFNNDFAEDILVIKNTGIGNSCQLELYENNGGGVYTIPSSPAVTGLTNSSPVGFANIFDYNNDGFSDIMLGTKDVVAPGPGNSGCKVFQNNGNYSFTDVTSSFNTYTTTDTGDFYNAHVFDLDNDGDLDVLWEINRTGQGTSRPSVMLNNGLNVFTNIRSSILPNDSINTNHTSRYFVFDYNHDGALDIFIPGTGGIPATLHRNTFTTPRFIGIRLYSCTNPAEPVTARVYVREGTKRIYKTYSSQNISSTHSGKSEVLYFGLGNLPANQKVDSIMVFWPDGRVDEFINLPIDSVVKLTNGFCNLGDPMFFDLGSDTIAICNQFPGFLFAAGGFETYDWSNGDQSQIATITEDGWYHCIVTTADGCVARDSIYAGFSVGGINEKDTTVCPKSPVHLTAYPRFDCSPFGAPKRRVVKAGDPIPNMTYINSLNGHHYYVFNSNSNWSQAESTAVSLGGHLAVINDQVEADFIAAQPALAMANLWIGMYRDTTAGSQFRWVNCDTSTFTQWASSAPVSGKFNNKVYIRNGSCTDANRWLNTDESANLSDPCESSFFGLVEFDPHYNIKYKWFNGDTLPYTTVSPNESINPSVNVTINGLSCFGVMVINVVDANNQLELDTIKECKASFIAISAQPGMTSYLWNTIPIRTTQTIFVGVGGSNRWYKVNVVTPEGCSGMDSVYVILSNAAIKTPDTTVCLGSTITIRGPNPPYSYVTDYQQNFQGFAPYPSWSSSNNISFDGSKVLGPFADKFNDSITFSHFGLPIHDSVRVTFDLYIHDTWEGNCSVTGPDQFRFKNNNTNILSTTFSNRASCTQNYPTNGSPAFSGAAAVGLPRRCDLTSTTTKYTITRGFAHTDPDLFLTWVSDLKDSVDNTNKCNESWSMDNVVIQLRRPGSILWSTGDTTEDIIVTISDTSQEYWVEVPIIGGFCYDTITVRGVTGKLDVDMFTQDTMRICGSDFATLIMPLNFDTYIWSNGDNNRITQVYNDGWYGGFASTVTGCYNFDSLYFSKGQSTMIPQNDTMICPGIPVTFTVDNGIGCSQFGSPANTGYLPNDPIPGYTFIGEYHGHYYYQADTRSSWSSAAQSALAAGGHLACINDQLEQNFIAENTTANVWLGLYFNPNLGYPIWMNCDTLTFANWAAGEPTASPEDFVFMMGTGCPEEKRWDSHEDDDQVSTDPCYKDIFGLLEITPNQYEYDWWVNGVSTYTSESITVYPNVNTFISALVKRYPGGGNCGIGNIKIDVYDEGFGIIPDSITKLGCEGDTVMIEALPGFANYNWDNGDTNQIATYSGVVGYVYCYYDNGICQFKDSVYLTVPGKLVTTPTVTDITCFGANDGIGHASFTGGMPPVAILWLHNGSTNPLEPGLSPGTYYYSLIDSIGCAAMDSVTITNPDSALGVKFTTLIPVLCNGDSTAQVLAEGFGGTGPYTGTWVGYPFPDTLFFAKAGVYSYTITDARGCTRTFEDTLLDPPALSIITTQLKQIRCPDDSNGMMLFTASGGTQPYAYFWNLNPLANDTAFNVYNGDHYAIVVDTNGCYDTASFRMDASHPEFCGIVVSSGFTPNGDGQNDFLIIRGLSMYPENELTVFNRWGESVYHATNYQNNWDGKPSSKVFGTTDEFVPNDTYFYVLVTKENNKTYSGYIYITK